MRIRIVSSYASALIFLLFVWAKPLYAEVTFIVDVQADTPPGDFITFTGYGPLFPDYTTVYPMTKIGEHTWMIKLDMFHPDYLLEYRYGRNGSAEGGAGDSLGHEGFFSDIKRQTLVAAHDTVIRDSISEWRWRPIDGLVPDIDLSAFESTAPIGLPREFMSGVQLPDFWDRNWILPVDLTLDRIRDTVNARWVQYTPVPAITQHDPLPTIANDVGNTTPEADLVRILQSAENRGLNMFLRPLLWPGSGVSLGNSDIRDGIWWNTFFDQLRPVYLSYARMAEQHGVDLLGFSPWFGLYSLTQRDFSFIDPLASSLLGEVRDIYHGQIAVDFNSRFEFQVYGEGDYLMYKFWATGGKLQKNSTLDELLSVFRESLDAQGGAAFDKWQKPIILNEIAASSYEGAFINQPNWEDHGIWYPDDPNTLIDLQGQANAYEAMLKAIAERDWIAGSFSFSYWYWDGIDKTPSVRGKPAEQVLAKWYGWFDSSSAGIETPLLPPSLVTSEVNDGTLHISWTRSPGAAGYELHYGYGAHNYIDSVDLANVDRLSVPGAPVGTYYYSLLAYDEEANKSSLTAEVSVGVGIDHVQTPKNFYVAVDGHAVTFSWDPLTNATGFVLYYGSSPGQYVGSVRLAESLSGEGWTFEKKVFYSYKVADVPSGTYYVALKAENTNGLSSGFTKEIRVDIP